MRTLLCFLVLLAGCFLPRNSALAQTTTLYCGPTTNGPFTISTPVVVCNQTTPLTWRQYFNYNSYPNSIGPDPYRIRARLLHNGVEIAQQLYEGPSTEWNFYFEDIPSLSGNYTMNFDFEVRQFPYTWNSFPQNWFGNTIFVLPQACCYPDVTISGNFSTALQESSTWIKSSGTTVIPNGSNVKLDADAASYIQLNPGFETQAGSVFLAKAYNGCNSGAPALPVKEEVPTETAAKRTNEVIAAEHNSLQPYPNPTTGWTTVGHDPSVKEIQVFDVAGKLLFSVETEEGKETRIDLTEQPKGIYLLKADGVPVRQLVKQ